MKKLAVLFASMFIMAITVQNVSAQNEATISNASAGATIVSSIALTNNFTLEFGEIVRSATGGNVVITASETPTRTPSGNLTFMPNDTWRPSKFTVTGDSGQSFKITKPGTITLNGPSSSNMTITTSISGGTTGLITTGGSGGIGTYEFYIGGTLVVAATQQTGTYVGTYEVTVEYE